MALGLSRSAVDDMRVLGLSAEHVCTSIDRMLQQLDHRMVCRRPPFDPAADAALTPDRQLQLGLPGPQEHLASAAEFPELAKDESDCLDDPLVRIHLDASELIPAVTGRQREAQLTAAGFGVPGCQPPLAK